MKAKTLLVAAVMFLAFSAAAFAQATFQVGSIPVTAVTATGQTEGTGAITFSVASGVTSPGTISISYGSNVIITSKWATVTVTNGLVCGVGGCSGTALGVNTLASSYNPGVLVIDVPGNATGQFTVKNLRVAVANTGLTSLDASISSVANAIVAGQTLVRVISSIANGIATVDSDSVTVIGTTRGTDQTANLYVKEGYLNAFNDTTYGGIGFPLWIRFRLSAAPPAGVTIEFPPSASTDSTGVFNATDPSSGGDATAASLIISSTNTALDVYYRLTSNSNSSAIETLKVPVHVKVASDATLPLASAATVSFQASLAPIGNPLDKDGNPIDPTAINAPRFAELNVGPKPIFAVSGSNTSMLIPFASTVSSTGYNTGIAIANSTLDKGKTVLGITKAAVPQGGSVLFWFYPQQSGSTAGVPFYYQTSASSPGTGLDANGNVPAGSTYTVLLSQLLAAAQAPADFSGHIYVITGFTNAHCQYIITDFKAFANGGQALILPLDRTGREALSH